MNAIDRNSKHGKKTTDVISTKELTDRKSKKLQKEQQYIKRKSGFVKQWLVSSQLADPQTSKVNSTAIVCKESNPRKGIIHLKSSKKKRYNTIHSENCALQVPKKVAI